MVALGYPSSLQVSFQFFALITMATEGLCLMLYTTNTRH